MVVHVGDKVVVSKRNKERTVFCEYFYCAAAMDNGLMRVIQLGQALRQGKRSLDGPIIVFDNGVLFFRHSCR